MTGMVSRSPLESRLFALFDTVEDCPRVIPWHIVRPPLTIGDVVALGQQGTEGFFQIVGRPYRALAKLDHPAAVAVHLLVVLLGIAIAHLPPGFCLRVLVAGRPDRASEFTLLGVIVLPCEEDGKGSQIFHVQRSHTVWPAAF